MKREGGIGSAHGRTAYARAECEVTISSDLQDQRDCGGRSGEGRRGETKAEAGEGLRSDPKASGELSCAMWAFT